MLKPTALRLSIENTGTPADGFSGEFTDPREFAKALDTLALFTDSQRRPLMVTADGNGGVTASLMPPAISRKKGGSNAHTPRVVRLAHPEYDRD